MKRKNPTIFTYFPGMDLKNIKEFYDFTDNRKSGAIWAPPCDIYETKEHIVIKLEVPGIDEKDINLNSEGSSLTIMGNKRVVQDIKEENFFRMERQRGFFQRKIELSRAKLPLKWSFELKDGIMSVFVNKLSE